MTLGEILMQCHALGIDLVVVDTNLKVTGNKKNLTNELLALLKEHKEDLIALLGGQHKQILPRPLDEPLALSNAQLRIWVLEQLEGQSRQYNMPAAFLVKGRLQAELLEQAIQLIVARHEPLRTVFRSVQEQVIPLLLTEYQFKLQREDLSQLEGEAQQVALTELLQREAEVHFDLQHELMVKGCLIELGQHQQLFTVTMHHIAFDDMSIAIFMQELNEHYVRLSAKEYVVPAPLAIRYHDYAVWQRQQIEQGHFESMLGYWQQQLQGAPSHHSLPTLPRQAGQHDDGVTFSKRIDLRLVESFETIARDYGVTPFMAYFAVFNVVLMRISDSLDVVVGTPVSGRLDTELQSMIGMFVNSLPVRFQAESMQMRFCDYLAICRQSLIGALSNQDVPFDKIVERVNPHRSVAHAPLFQIMFSMGQVNLDTFQVRDAELLVHSHHYQTQAKFDLSFDVIRDDEGAGLVLEYKAAIFDHRMMVALMDAMIKVMEQVCLKPETPLNRLQLLDRDNQGPSGQPLRGLSTIVPTFRELFQQQVLLRPAKTAVSEDTQCMSYQQLDEASDAVAATLVGYALPDESIVAVTGERGVDFITAVLGVIKAGLVYLPLANNLPLQRKQQLLASANARLVLHCGHVHGQVEAFTATCTQPCPVVAVTACRTASIDTFVWRPVDPQQLMYTVFTSGSTGKPKGAMLLQQGFDAHNQSIANTLRLNEQDVVAQSADVAFDISVWQMLTPLTVGAEVAVIDEQSATDPAQLYTAITQRQVTILQLVPTIFDLLLDQFTALGAPSTLRSVSSTGEKLSAELARRALTLCPQIPLLNAYGPAECSDDITFQWFHQLADIEQDIIPIGKPVCNSWIYLLDDYMEMVPHGVEGELYIGGAQVGRGYLDAADLTAAAFVPDPFSGIDGGRLYRTGDKAKLDHHGRLLYSGRSDFQVKINGQRVELGEIESAINRLMGINSSLVKLSNTAHGTEVLTAYILATLPVTSQQIEAELAQLLPVHMVPRSYVFVEKWPLNANGKVDRKALPMPVLQQPQQRIAASNETEQLLCDIWAKLLKNQQVGINENFFALGGDSILGIQMAGLMRAQGWFISSRHIYQYQTIAELAAVATPMVQQKSQQALSGVMPLLPVQQEFLLQQATQQNEYNQCVWLSAPSGLPQLFWQRFIEALVTKHDILRLSFHRQDGKWLASYVDWNSNKTATVLEFHGAVDATERAERAEQRLQALNSSLSLQHGPLFRFAYLDSKSADLVMVFHHLVVDGVSWRIISQELTTAYQQFLRGETIDLGLKTSSFQHWVTQCQQQLQQGAFAQEKALWAAQLARPVSPLPTDLVTESNKIGTTEKVTVTLNSAQVEQLFSAATRAYGAAANEVLLTVLGQAFAQAWQVDTLRVDMESHGRFPFDDDTDLSQTLGWFTSVYPVTLSSAGKDIGASLVEVKDSLRRIPRGGIGFGLLCASSEESIFDSFCPAEIEFNYLGVFRQTDADAHFGVERLNYSSYEGTERLRTYKLGFNALLLDDVLMLEIDYSHCQYHADSIQHLARQFLQAVDTVTQHCLAVTQRQYTVADFPWVDVSLDDLRQWQAEYGELSALYPCSPMQQGMIFHSLMDDKEQTYNSVTLMQLRGALDEQAFVDAWHAVIARHPMLRTRFVGLDRQVFIQLVTPDLPPHWQWLDISDQPLLQQEQQIESYRSDSKKTPFSLDKGPLMRFTVIKTGPEQYQLLWTYHHVILDGWCLPLIFQQVMVAYGQRLAGQYVDTTSADSYDNYLAWLQQQDQATAMSHWAESLQGVDLPTVTGANNLPETYGQPQGYDSVHIVLEKEQFARLEAVAKAHQCTLNTLVQLAWAYLNHSYSRQMDIVFGTTVAGRPTEVAGIEHMIGLFINTLPIKVSFAAGQTLHCLIKQISDSIQIANEHSYIPLYKIQQQVHGEGPIFESLVVFENYPLDKQQLAAACSDSLTVTDVYVEEQTNYPLTLIATPGVELDLQLVFQQTEYTKARVQQMLDSVGQILLSMLEQPNPPVAALRLHKPETMIELVDRWNETAQVVEQGLALHQLFERQADLTPDAIAIVSKRGNISYGELEIAANQLSNILIAKGVKPGDYVPVCVPRSHDMVVAVLAVLKAGAAYVPLEPALPIARKLSIIADIAATVMVTVHTIAHDIAAEPAMSALHLIELDQPWPISSSCRSELSFSGKEVAYIIFTSGSTGQPKGVMLQHDPVVNLIHWVNSSYQVAATDRLLFIASLSFDLSVYDIFGILAAGASLYVADDDEKADPEQLAQIIETHQISFWDSAPAALMQLTSFMPTKGSDTLRLVFLSGDWIPLSLPPALQSVYANVQVIALGGATEAAIWSNFYPVKHIEPHWRSVPYGLPITNARYYVLDRDLSPCPIGVTGDLYIGGQCLSLGYFKQPELTASRYLPDPYAKVPGGVLYYTGDTARRMPDGNIEFIGRVDNQIKLRGFRIELGEIDAVLKQDSRIREVLSMVREDTSGVKKLVVYLQLMNGAQLTLQDAKALVTAQLPDYMSPAAMVLIEQWPTTVNGKLDRNALPAPVYKTDNSYVQPVGDIELQLAEIWQQLLGVTQVGRFDNFFELGGDSIISIQLVTKARRLGIHLSPRDVFRAPTIAGLAVSVNDQAVAVSDQTEISGSAVVTPVQSWWLSKQPQFINHFNQALRLELKSQLDVGLFEQALHQVYRHHDALRLQLDIRTASAQSFIESVKTELLPKLHVFDLTKDAGATRQTMDRSTASIADQLQASLDLQKGPSMLAALFDYGPQQAQELLVVVHHWNIDGVSWRFLLEDLERAYTALSQGRDVVLDLKTASWVDWSHALLAVQQHSLIQAQRQYWQQQIDADTIVLAQRSDALTAPVSQQRQAKVQLDSETTATLLRQTCKATRATMEELLLTSLAQTMLLSSTARALTIDLESHGREMLAGLPDVSRTIGWFTAIYPLNLQLDNPQDVAASLIAVKESLRRVPNGGIGYGLLEQTSGLHGHAKAQLTFNYLGQFDNATSHSALFTLSDKTAGKAMNDADHLPYLLEMAAQVRNGQLEIELNYSQLHYDEVVVSQWLESICAHLKALVQFAGQLEQPLYSAVDFPLASLNRATTQTLVRHYPQLEDIYDLTAMQQGLMYHTISSDSGHTYIGKYLFEIKGDIQNQAFKSAWQQVVQRHACLRSRFVMSDSGQYQVVLSAAALAWETADWSELTSEQQITDRLAQWQHQQQHCPFALAEAPALRFMLIRLAANRYYFHVSFHHIILDGWSLAVMNRDAALLYRALCDNQVPQLAEPAPIAHYVEWLKQQSAEQALGYWRSMLEDIDETSALPDWRKPDASVEAPSVSRHLSSTLTHRLQQLAQQQQLTLNTLVQAAWGLTLSHFNGKANVVFGVTVSGRPTSLPDVDQMVGLFINTLPMRLQTSGSILLVDWLRQVQQQQVESSRYEYSSLAQIQRCTQLPPGHALFDSYVVFENFPDDPDFIRQTTGLDIQGKVANFRGSYPLAVQVNPGTELEIKGIFEPTKLHQDTVSEYIEHMAWVLATLCDNLTQPLNLLPTCDPRSAKRLRQRQVEVQKPDWVTLFEQHAALNPDSIAVVCDKQRFSYFELNAKANQLAHLLTSFGVGTDDRIALCMRRSANAIVTMLAANKIGAGFVPLNPDLPLARLQFVVANAQTRVFVTESNCSEIAMALADERQSQLLFLDSAESCSAYSQQNPSLVRYPQALAYILYTSGSTGMPKGVMIEQRQLTQYVHNSAERLLFERGMKYLHMLPFDGDGGYTVIFPALATGGELHILPETDLLNPNRLRDYLLVNGIDCVKIPPSYLQALMTDAVASDLLPKKRLILGMETSHTTMFADLEQQIGDGLVFNHYGPTETTIGMLTFRREQLTPFDASLNRQSVPLGWPLPHASVYVLDEQLRHVQPGYAGEIVIGGYSLARGYLDQTALTAEKFVPDPYAEKPGMRMYRTGDLGRLLADGSIAFLGRIDHQVKIRGHRVELQGIDTVLQELAEIKTAVTVATGDNGQTTLVSYLVVQPDCQALTAAELSSELERKLPKYSVPSHFVYLDALPLTRAGKIDRKALPKPVLTTAETSVVTSKPFGAESQLSKTMLAVWSEVLAVPVTIHDNFFALGGDSIKAIMAVAKMRNAGIEITPEQLFEFHSLEAMATHLEAIIYAERTAELLAVWQEVLGNTSITEMDNFFALGGDSISAIMVVAKASKLGYKITPQQLFEYDNLAELIRMVRKEAPVQDSTVVEGAMPLLPSQHRFFSQLRQNRNNFVQTVLLDLSPEVSTEFLGICLAQLPARHPALRSRFVEVAGQWTAQIGAADAQNQLRYQQQQLASAPDSAWLCALASTMAAELDISTGVLLSACSVSWPTGAHLLLVGHHLVVDGISWRIMVEDLTTLLLQQPLRPAAGNLIQWAQALQQHAEQLTVAQIERWTNQLSVPGRLTDIDEPGRVAGERTIALHLPSAVTASLLSRDSHDVYKTDVEIFLLSAFSMACAQIMGRSRVALMLEHHGRNVQLGELQNRDVVCWSTNAYPIILEAAPADTGLTIKQTKEAIRWVGDDAWHFPLLRYLRKELQFDWAKHPVDVLFHYMADIAAGSDAAIIQLSRQSAVAREDEQEYLPYPLVVNASMSKGELQVLWSYSSAHFAEEQIQALADAFTAQCLAIADHCATATSQATPSDFKLAKLDQKRLDKLMNKYKQGR